MARHGPGPSYLALVFRHLSLYLRRLHGAYLGSREAVQHLAVPWVVSGGWGGVGGRVVRWAHPHTCRGRVKLHGLSRQCSGKNP